MGIPDTLGERVTSLYDAAVQQNRHSERMLGRLYGCSFDRVPIDSELAEEGRECLARIDQIVAEARDLQALIICPSRTTLQRNMDAAMKLVQWMEKRGERLQRFLTESFGEGDDDGTVASPPFPRGPSPNRSAPILVA